MIDARPRWRHKCPGCNRTIYWEKVYCLPCIKEQPQREGYRLTHNQRWLKKYPLRGVLRTRNHLFVVVNTKTICVECGQKIEGSLKHRCYFRLETRLLHRQYLNCVVCDERKPKATFPMVKRGRDKIRLRVCTDCLHLAEMVVPRKRKYERRVASCVVLLFSLYRLSETLSWLSDAGLTGT